MDWQNVLGIPGIVAGVAGGYYAWRALDDAAVKTSQDKFRETRTALRVRTGVLSEVAAEMHIKACPSLRRIGASSLLVDETMRPPSPVPVTEIKVEWDGTDPPFDSGLMDLSQRVLPLRKRWKRFASYSAALGTLMPPALFENRFSYRLVKADWTGTDGPRLVLGRGKYFDLIDQCESLVHELALADRGPDRAPRWRKVPMRARLKADPLSLSRRPVLSSIGTLTIRRTPDGQGTFFLLHRGVGQVAIEEDVYNVIPGGMYQPASISPGSVRGDLSMWRNIMREYNEEMLGAPEAAGRGGTEVDYTRPPYRNFERALADGRLRVWSFGMGLEPLGLVPCFLTIAVFDDDVFDRLFSTIVDRNDEGILISGPRVGGVTGLVLNEPEVDDLLENFNVSPITAALLHLALEHRELLLGT